jgi:hypothetical protein
VVPTGIESFPSRIFIPVDTTGRLQGNVFKKNKKNFIPAWFCYLSLKAEFFGRVCGGYIIHEIQINI